MKLKKRRAYVWGRITSTLNQLKEMFDPEAAASAPSETLILSLISDVEEKIKTLDEFTEAICLELDDELMQEEVENNSKYVLSVKTQIAYVCIGILFLIKVHKIMLMLRMVKLLNSLFLLLLWNLLRTIAAIPLLISPLKMLFFKIK